MTATARRRIGPQYRIIGERRTDELTPREFEVLEQAALGNKRPETARHLGITLETVKSHHRSILAKLGARNIANAVAIAFRTGIFFPVEPLTDDA